MSADSTRSSSHGRRYPIGCGCAVFASVLAFPIVAFVGAQLSEVAVGDRCDGQPVETLCGIEAVAGTVIGVIVITALIGFSVFLYFQAVVSMRRTTV